MTRDLAIALQLALADTDRVQAQRIVETAVQQGEKAETVLFQFVLPAVERTCQDICDGGEVSLAQHFMTSQIAADLAAWLIPRFKNLQGPAGCIVMGTATGDFHGLGKTIVSACLRAHHFTVHDLGLNVAAETFVDEALRRGATVIGISSMMVHTALSEAGCRRVRRILRDRSLERQIKVIVGGAPFRHDPQLYQAAHADAWASDGMAAVGIIRQLNQEAGA